MSLRFKEISCWNIFCQHQDSNPRPSCLFFSWQDWLDHVFKVHVGAAEGQGRSSSKTIKVEPGLVDLDEVVASPPELSIKIIDVRSLSDDPKDGPTSGNAKSSIFLAEVLPHFDSRLLLVPITVKFKIKQDKVKWGRSCGCSGPLMFLATWVRFHSEREIFKNVALSVLTSH